MNREIGDAPAAAVGDRPAEPTALDRIACGGCGRWFTTVDGPAMLAAITGGCPRCGGDFALMSSTDDESREDGSQRRR